MPFYTDDCDKLTREEEHELVIAAKQGDLEARERLIKSCVPWAMLVAAKYSRVTQCNLHDMTQQAFLGLIDAVDRFDPNRGTRLTTYAYHYIRRDCLRWMKSDRLIHIPFYEQDKNNYGDIPSKFVPCSLEKARPDDMMFAYTEHEIAEHNDEMELFKDCLEVLDERTQWIIMERFKTKGRTLKDIGKELGITRERVRQIQQKGLDDLCYMMTGVTQNQKQLV